MNHVDLRVMYCLCINLLEHVIFLASFIEQFQTSFFIARNEKTFTDGALCGCYLIMAFSWVQNSNV